MEKRWCTPPPAALTAATRKGRVYLRDLFRRGSAKLSRFKYGALGAHCRDMKGHTNRTATQRRQRNAARKRLSITSESKGKGQGENLSIEDCEKATDMARNLLTAFRETAGRAELTEELEEYIKDCGIEGQHTFGHLVLAQGAVEASSRIQAAKESLSIGATLFLSIIYQFLFELPDCLQNAHNGTKYTFIFLVWLSIGAYMVVILGTNNLLMALNMWTREADCVAMMYRGGQCIGKLLDIFGAIGFLTTAFAATICVAYQTNWTVAILSCLMMLFLNVFYAVVPGAALFYGTDSVSSLST